jgi:hypothetical protein
MGWDRKGKHAYYSRSRRVGRRVVREYLGAGEEAQQAAREDAARRQAREAERAARQEALAEMAALDPPLDELNALADLAAAAALLGAGCHRHHRGPWRRRRTSS